MSGSERDAINSNWIILKIIVNGFKYQLTESQFNVQNKSIFGNLCCQLTCHKFAATFEADCWSSFVENRNFSIPPKFSFRKLNCFSTFAELSWNKLKEELIGSPRKVYEEISEISTHQISDVGRLVLGWSLGWPGFEPQYLLEWTKLKSGPPSS